MKGLHSLFFLLIFAVGCSEISNSNLAGSWTAVSMEINNEKVEVDLSEVKLDFDNSGGYNFHSTLNYQESGFYEIAQQFLFTIDTLGQDSQEKKVEIIEFTGSSMTIKMQEKNEERVIKFIKN